MSDVPQPEKESVDQMDTRAQLREIKTALANMTRQQAEIQAAVDALRSQLGTGPAGGVEQPIPEATRLELEELYSRIEWLTAYNHSITLRLRDLEGTVPLARRPDRPAYHAVAVASIGRTGSMWVWNIVREVLETHGWSVLALDSPDFDKAFYTAGLAQRDLVCLHYHEVQALRAGTRYIIPYRDVRDVLLSTMRFNRVDFETALTWLSGSMSSLDHFLTYDGAISLKLRYEDMITAPIDTIMTVASFLDARVGADTAGAIAERYSQSGVQQMIDRNDSYFRPTTDAHYFVRNYRRLGKQGSSAVMRGFDLTPIAKNPDESLRIIDRETRFQTGHITSRAPGEWREVLSAEQQERLNAMTADWLRRHGYEV